MSRSTTGGGPGTAGPPPDQVLRQHELTFYWSRPSLARRSVGGAVNTSWSRCTQRGTEAIVIRLDVTTCAACPVRDQRATAPRSGRQLSLRPGRCGPGLRRAAGPACPPRGPWSGAHVRCVPAGYGRGGAHGLGVPRLPRGVRDRTHGGGRPGLPEAAADPDQPDAARDPLRRPPDR